MKKSLLLFKSFFVILCLMFCALSVYAIDDNVPKAINLQGRYTKSYGDPVVNETITVKYLFKDHKGWGAQLSTTTVTDNEGLYNINLPVTLSSTTNSFKIGINNDSFVEYPLASSPFSLYSSTATFALSLDSVNGEKLNDNNFYKYSGLKDTHTYTIKVDSAIWADNAVKSKEISVSTDVANVVWGYNGSKQTWIDVGSAVAPDLAKSANKLNTGDGTTKLEDANFFGYTGSTAHTYAIKVDSSVWADNAVIANKLNSSFKLSNGNFNTSTEYSNLKLKSSNFSTSTEYSNLKLKNSNFTENTVYTTTASWAENAITANGLSSSFKLTNGNFNTSTEYSNLKLKSSNFSTDTEYSNLKLKNSNFTDNTVYTTTVSWAENAITANGLSGSFKLSNENFNTETEYSNLKLVSDNFKDNIEYSNLRLKNSNFTDNTVYTTTVSWAENAVTANGLNSSFKLSNENFNTETEYSNLKLVSDNFKDNIEYSNLKLNDSNFKENTVYATTASWAQHAIDAETINSGKTVSLDNDSSIVVWARGDDGQGWYTISKVSDYQNANISGADLAEIYQSSEKLVPGDVVSIDTTKDNAIVKTKVAEDTLVAGVISTEPGVLMNQNEKGYKLALVGKVPTKVCNEGGAIKRGDLLVSASIPGYAKKAGDNPKAGTIIGKALGNLDSQKGTILVLVNLQ